jgi:hypothetical protein
VEEEEEKNPMTDIIVSRLPRFVDQFRHNSYDPSPSLFKCGPAAGAICTDFHYPDKYDVNLIAHNEYQKLVGPDVSSDQMGVTNSVMIQFFKDMNVPVIDMQELVNTGLNTGNYQPLYDEIEAQNKQGIIQFMSVADEALLIDDATGASLHPGLHYGHCIVRLGFSTDAGYGLYYDPANAQACTDPKTGKNVPVRISWSNSILKAKPNFCMAIMPPGVSLPPAQFSFQKGTWPAPAKPAPDLVKLASNLDSMSGTLKQMQSFLDSFSAELKAVQGDL